MREAQRALEARAKEEAAAKGQPAERAKPDPKAQYNFTNLNMMTRSFCAPEILAQ